MAPAARPTRLCWHLDPSVTATLGPDDEVTLGRDDLAPVRATFEADAGIEVEVLGPDEERCAGLRFGFDGTPTPTSTLEVRVEPGRDTRLVSRFELP